MGNSITALIFVVVLNALLFMAQFAILDINPSATRFYTTKDDSGIIIERFSANGTYILDDSDSSSKLPTATQSISPTTGNIFTDTFSSIKSWVSVGTGVNYITGMLSAPYNMLKWARLPDAFCFAIGSLWYAISLFIIVSFFWGKD